MKLELKYISPYLPYNLNGKYVLSDVIKLAKCHKDEIRDKKLTEDCVLFFRLYCKPILSPISDLEKLIKSEFEKLDELGMSNYTSEIIDLFCYENTGFDENITEINLEKLPYECVEYMFKNHYDFFGLIQKGLAIDKNTLL